jgi:serine/threonine protein kinase
MPVIEATEKFIDVVRRSNLVDESRLAPYLQQLAEHGALTDQPGTLANQMIRDAIITPFQAKQLLQGRWRRFVIANKYRVLDLLGQGGMGAVYLCEHAIMRRLVALKVLPEDKLAQPGALERFQREARAVAALDHPNIVHAYDMDCDEKLHFMVMEYVDGLSLEQIVSKHYKDQGMDPVRAAHYMNQAALGLEQAHAGGWVHRDIKPANLLLDRHGVIKILDMGLSRLFADDVEQLTQKYDGGSVLGTADYIAPEQALNVSKVDIRADIYGLGGTFYFILTGRPPFEKGTIAQKLMYHQTREPDSLLRIRPDLPPELVAVVNKMMAKDPNQRYADPTAIVEALAPWTQTPIPPPPDVEMPNHCPLVRSLSPTLATNPGSRSSSSWRAVKVQTSASALPTVKVQPAVPAPPPMMQAVPMPEYTPARETMVDVAGAQAVTPKNLPRVHPDEEANTYPTQGANRSLILLVACVGGAVILLVVALLIFAVIKSL